MNPFAGLAPGLDGSRRAAAAELGLLLLLFAVLHAAVLRWVFPGYYAPLWPHHSDMYIPPSLASLPGHWAELAMGARPVGFLFFKLIGQLGLHGAMAASIALVLVNMAVTAMLLRRWSVLPLTPWFMGAAAVYAFAVFAHPGYYVLGNWDVFSQLAWLLLLLAAWLLPRQGMENSAGLGSSRAIFFGLLTTAAFLAKETFAATSMLLAVWWALAGPLRTRRDAWLPAALIALASVLSQVLPWLSTRNALSNSEHAYVVSLVPASVWGEWSRYAAYTFDPWTTVALLAAVVGTALASRKLNAVPLLLAGMLAWLPNALLPNHWFAAYAWNGSLLLFAPLLMLPTAVTRGWLPRGLGLLALAAMVAAPAGQAARYQAQFWPLEQEAMQRRLVHAVNAQLAALPAGQAQQVLVTGLLGPFSPFDNGLWQLVGRPEIEVTVAIYGAQDKTSRYAKLVGRMPDFVPAAAVTMDRFSQVWAFRADGMLWRAGAPGVLADGWSPELLLYPEVLAARERGQQSGPFIGALDTGTAWLRYGQAARAVAALQAAAAADPQNPYPWHYLSLAHVALGQQAQALAASLQAVELDNPRQPNPAFAKQLATLR